jgi:transcriptional regulator with XRE-family HTH domain
VVGGKEEANEKRVETRPNTETHGNRDRLKQLREQKELSQGDIEERTGLLRCYVSRVENNHTVPSVDTLEKMARALEVPLYRLFYDGDKPPAVLKLPQSKTDDWGGTGKDASTLRAFRKAMSKTSANDIRMFVFMAQKMVTPKATSKKREKRI